MSSASLVRVKKSNLTEAAHRKNGRFMEYEFGFPYNNEGLGDSLWELGKAYQIAFLVGPTEKFAGVNEETWMSDQIHIRLGGPSTDSIYHPPYLAQQKDSKPQGHSHGNEGKKR